MVFLTAAPGYGKTRLLDRWVAERRRAGHAAVLVTAKAVNSALVHAVERAATLLTGGTVSVPALRSVGAASPRSMVPWCV